MKFLIVNGPNINMLGVREPDIYGTLTYEGLCDTIAQAARGMGVEVEFFQSNSEGDIVTAIQNALGRMDGIVINPAAYTHTSVAILDALKAVALPAAEVHISDVTKREAFRQRSFAGMACRYHFVGEGRDGYVHALETLKRDIEGSLIILHAMPRSEWEACRAAGAVGAHLPEGGFLHCSPVEYFWRVAPGHYADGGPTTPAGITRTSTARAPFRPSRPCCPCAWTAAGSSSRTRSFPAMKTAEQQSIQEGRNKP